MLRLLFVTTLMLSGCTYSTNPIFTEQDNLFDEALVGTWQADGGLSDFATFELTRWTPDEKSYRVVICNQAGKKQGTIQAYLSQIDENKFLTAKFEHDKPSSTFPARVIYWTLAIDQLDGEQLKVRSLRGDWLAQQVKRNPQVLKHVWYAQPAQSDKNNLLLTASTAELRAFVLSHLDKTDAWMPDTFRKIRLNSAR